MSEDKMNYLVRLENGKGVHYLKRDFVISALREEIESCSHWVKIYEDDKQLRDIEISRKAILKKLATILNLDLEGKE